MEGMNARLDEVRREFRKWRTTRQGREPIPDELLRSAGVLCNEMSISKVAKALRLNHARLKEWIPTGNTTLTQATFAEVRVAGSISPMCKVVFERPDGLRMTVETNPAEVHNLVEAFVACSS